MPRLHGKGQTKNDINNRWHMKLKESSRIIKPPVQGGQHSSSFSWTAKDDAVIVRMNEGGSSYAEIASALGKGLNKNDIKNRWHKILKELSGIIKPYVQGSKHSSITGLQRL